MYSLSKLFPKTLFITTLYLSKREYFSTMVLANNWNMSLASSIHLNLVQLTKKPKIWKTLEPYFIANYESFSTK